MSKNLRLTIVSQEERLLDQEVEAVTLSTANGLITILKDHQPLISKLTVGELIYQVAGQKHQLFITQGFVNKKPDNQVLVVVDSAFNARGLNEEKVRAALEEARKAYGVTKDKRELLMIESSLKQLFWELQIANKKKKS